MNGDVILNIITLLGVVIVLGLKALVFHRTTRLGEAIASLNFVFVFIYTAAILGIWFDIFMTHEWRVFVRLLIIVFASWVIWELKRAYGGWVPLLIQAW